MNTMTKEQKTLRYAISVDFDCLKDQGKTFREAMQWFGSKEAVDTYDGYVENGIYLPSNENFLSVAKEVATSLKLKNKWARA